jgi:signal transduction histidine kinase
VPIWSSNPVSFWLVMILVALQSASILALVSSRRLLRRTTARLSALTRRLQFAQDEEQARLSRELHDTLGQDLLSQALDLERYAPAAAAPQQPPFAGRLRRSVTRLESIARELNPNALRLLDLRGSLSQLAADLRARTEIAVDVAVPDEEPPLSPEVRATLFRIVQEALANVRRHSRAANAAVLVHRRGAALELTVRDDGVGFDVSRRTEARLGLLGMQERAAAVGATLAILSAPNDGTTVSLVVPLSATI